MQQIIKNILKNILSKSFSKKKISLFFIGENYIYFVHRLLYLHNEVISIYSKINFEKSNVKASSLT